MGKDIYEFQRPALILRFIEGCAEKGHEVIITRVACTEKEQAKIYAQGRTKPGKIVTWTLDSKHVTGKKRSASAAFDFAIYYPDKKKCEWDPKVDVDMDQIPDYEECARVAESLGLISGARFKDGKGRPRPDYPHVELPEG